MLVEGTCAWNSQYLSVQRLLERAAKVHGMLIIYADYIMLRPTQLIYATLNVLYNVRSAK